MSPGAMAFDAEYARWLEEQNTHINELRIAVNSHASDPDLRIIVEKVATHFKNLVRLKDTAAKDDVFLIFSGMWKPPAIRCFMWIGGFRPSKLLKLLVDSLRPLTKLQEADINNLEQSSHEAEEALSQQMEALQQSLAETLVNGTCVPEGSSGNMGNYMGRMANAMGKLVGHEGFFREAEKLRQQTLERMHLILTPRQSARALLTMHEYFLRLKALGDLWMTRPRE